MTAQPSVDQFLETVERSGLVERTRLEEVLNGLERETGPDAVRDTQIVSSHLTRRGLITGWQNERLLEGRHRGFFLGKYKLLDHLGSGGMSSVYLAEHRVMRRRVAIKVLPTNQAQDPSRVRRFHREARAVASLDHPHVVRAFDVDQEGDVHFLVMEYVPGRDLNSLVAHDGRLTPQLAAEYVRQAAEGLAFAHGHGLVHRDMKPANLIIDPQGQVKVLDLGLASVLNDVDGGITSEFDDKVLGTVDYLAPEQALDSHFVDGRADIYSLGCTLYFALAGRPPFPEGSVGQRIMAHQVREPDDLRQLRPEMPERLVKICQRMMAKSVSARYQNMDEVAAALADFLRAPMVAAPRSRADDELTLAPLEEERSGARERAASFGRQHEEASRGKSPSTARASPKAPLKKQSPSKTPRPVSGAKTPNPSRGVVKHTPRPTSPRREATPERSALDDLLADAPLASQETAKLPSLTSKWPVTRPSAAARPVAKNRWESPWFLIAVGTLLGMLLIALYFVLRLLLG